MNKKVLTREDVESMLADYAFGQLTPEESRMLESSIVNYPDLQKDLQEFQGFHTTMRSQKPMDHIDYRTRNLSVRVNDAMRKPNSHPWTFWFARFAPALGLGVVVFLYFGTTLFRPDSSLSFDEEMARLFAADSTSEIFHPAASSDNAFGPTPLVHDEAATAAEMVKDSEQLDRLLAESVVTASSQAQSSDGVSDEVSNEALDLLNSVEIQETEQMILEIENGAG